MDLIEVAMVEEKEDKKGKYPSTQANVHIAGTRVPMKVDSGADANVISSDCFDKIQQD